MRRQLAVTLTAITSSHVFRIKVVQGGQQAENAGIADKGVKPAPPAIERLSQPIDGGEVAQIHRNQGRRLRLPGPQRANFVVEFLKAALRAGERHHMRARLGQGESRSAANAARGPGHQRDPGRSLEFRRTQSTLLASFARLAYGAWLREDARRRRAGSPAPAAAARQAWIFICTDYRLDRQGSPGLKRGIRHGSDMSWRAFWGPAPSRADIAR